MRRLPAALSTSLLLVPLLAGCSGDDGGDSAPSEAAAGALAEELAAALVLAATPEEADPEETATATDGTGSDGTGSAGSSDSSAPGLAELPFADAVGTAVAEEYATVVDGMDGAVPAVEVDGVGEAEEDPEAAETVRVATLAWTWPVTDEDDWTYTSDAELVAVDGGDGWAVRWERTVVEPTLRKREVLDAATEEADRGDITGAGGAVLVTERPVLRYGIDKTKVAGKQAADSARTLARLVGIDVASYVKQVRAAGDSAYVEAITYRKGQVPAEVDLGADRIEGVLVVPDRIALAPTREFAAPILGRVGPVTAEMVAEDPEVYRAGDIAGTSGLQARYDEQLRGTPGRAVAAVRENGRRRALFTVDAVDGTPLATTLDPRLQNRAEELLADVGPASALVAIRPSDGSILVAANGPGTGGQNYATYGQAAPGSTFKIVSSLALLRDGLNPDSPVDCPATVTVDGKAFENYDDYPSAYLGRIPLRTAVAQSCNTAFTGQHGRIGKGDLAEAAGSLGLGIDHDLGFPAYFGQVPDPASQTEAAADLIGQGRILASPMVMATVIGSVQAGETVVPTLLPDYDATAEGRATRLTAREADQLRSMLREVVTSGSGRGLADLPAPAAIAKTGTAEFSADGKSGLHAWMVAAHGDLAVAVYVDRGESGSRTAGPILEAFLRAAG
ncbi:penicillin-binding transpeptidase domain-containing protein [Nocardioides sp. YIM 152588]|uniref:penicillin-binding transpeptidase domain-containing protein n=1 Tax=Nocardioides sp. YIM 152588 TaxID=3158259 RepID=UPI0032E4F664